MGSSRWTLVAWDPHVLRLRGEILSHKRLARRLLVLCSCLAASERVERMKAGGRDVPDRCGAVQVLPQAPP